VSDCHACGPLVAVRQWVVPGDPDDEHGRLLLDGRIEVLVAEAGLWRVQC
jgi:hypothetical protein